MNEYQWAKDLYECKRPPSKNGQYGDSLYLARYLIETGKNIREAVDCIFEWGQKNNVYFENRIIPICQKAMNMPKLRDHVDIHISKQEVHDIKTYLSKKNSQLLALAMLCYAKAFHSPSESFDISTYQLASWTGIARENISSRYIKDLETMQFIKKVEPDAVDKWQGFGKKKMNKYRFTFPLTDKGEYVLKDNDIVSFFNSL